MALTHRLSKRSVGATERKNYGSRYRNAELTQSSLLFKTNHAFELKSNIHSEVNPIKTFRLKKDLISPQHLDGTLLQS